MRRAGESGAISVNEAVVRDAYTGRWLHFHDPVAVVTVEDAGDVPEGLALMEREVETRGLNAVCMISYEASSGFDPLLPVHGDDAFPALWFALYRDPADAQGLFSVPLRPCTGMSLRPEISKEAYGEAFGLIRKHLGQGDVYQVNYTFRLRGAFEDDPWRFFAMFAPGHGDYGAFVLTEDWAVLSASPELFFSLEGDLLESRPMKGTAPRDKDPARDVSAAGALLSSPKERAENLMIVDMVRNDMGKVARPGSVEVPALFTLERYPTVWQLTSTVRARTRSPLRDILAALFPPASITGAPKKRSMEIIRVAERSRRRIYTGAIGWCGPGRKARFSVAIRTLLVDRRLGQAEYGVGGGVVWDSSMEAEWSECVAKSLVLADAARPFKLLETMLWVPGRGYGLLDHHLARLAASAEHFGFPQDPRRLRERLETLASSFGDTPMRVRLLVGEDGDVETETARFTPASKENPERVCLARRPVDRHDPFLYHKTTRRRVYEEALAEAAGYDDVVLYNHGGYVTESTRANVVARIDGGLVTPPVDCGLLPGTFRQWMLENSLARERPITVQELLEAEMVFLVNSVRGMYPVVVDGHGA